MERIIMVFLVFMFTVFMVFFLWMPKIAAVERVVSTSLYVFNTHTMHYTIWSIMAAMVMQASKSSAHFYRLIISGFISTSLFW